MAGGEAIAPQGPGVPLVLPDRLQPEPDIAASATRLVVAEQACCAFFDFTLRVTGGKLHLEVRGPHEAQAVIDSLFGVASDQSAEIEHKERLRVTPNS